VTAHVVPGAVPPGSGTAHPIGGEQSNTSVVVGGTHVLKVLRRLQPGANPEVEIGRHLAAVAASGCTVPVPPLAGWYDLHEGDATTTLGVLHELVPGALDAWSLVLSALAGAPDGLLARLHHLGASVAALHDALARPGEEPDAFGVQPLATHRVHDLVAALGTDAPTVLADHADPAAVTALAERLAATLPHDLGAAIRHHGDLHLGQVVLGPDGWMILDFEGEPSRPVAERRLRHSPLRDVAGMLRSLAYAAATHRRSRGRRLGAGWEPAARAAFLDGYLAHVDPALLPSSATATATLLRLFELEKVVYEVGYERAHRPDWVDVPVEGLHLLLAEDPA
jgi:maltokinase